MNEDAYAESMRALANAQPRDADLAVLAAEAQMNLHPYDWWDGRGAPRPWTAEIVSLRSRALLLEPRHPGANHYWVHLTESSSQPSAALESADRLASLVPGSGHLLPMPAHIHMRVGRYAEGRRSIAADVRYLAQVDAQRAYRVGYVAHNHHFLWAAAAMQGRSREAIGGVCPSRPPAQASPRHHSATNRARLVLDQTKRGRSRAWRMMRTGSDPRIA